jgi:hypothetical protein
MAKKVFIKVAGSKKACYTVMMPSGGKVTIPEKGIWSGYTNAVARLGYGISSLNEHRELNESNAQAAFDFYMTNKVV